jgi:hypothetical protein
LTREEMNHLFEFYVEENNILEVRDVSLYMYLDSLVRRNKKIVWEELVQMTEETAEQVTERLDRLERCLLLGVDPKISRKTIDEVMSGVVCGEVKV